MFERDGRGAISHCDRHLVWNHRDLYTINDVARYFGLSYQQVHKTFRWQPACDETCPGWSASVVNIWGTTVTHDLIVADAQILANRGYSLQQIAEHFGVWASTVTAAHEKAGKTLRLHPYYSSPSVRTMPGALSPGHEVVSG